MAVDCTAAVYIIVASTLAALIGEAAGWLIMYRTSAFKSLRANLNISKASSQWVKCSQYFAGNDLGVPCK